MNRSLTNDIIHEKEVQYRDSTITFRLSLETASFPLAIAPPNEVKRVLSNLLDNAVQSMTDGAVEVTLCLREMAICVKVSDQGCGIGDANLKRIGERGFSFGKKNGTGLGLYQAVAASRDWGGKLSITSEVGIGTQVTVTLPVARVSPTEILLQTNSQLVILDDDLDMQHVWKQKLSSLPLRQFKITPVYFSSVESLQDWLPGQDRDSISLFFIDLELKDPFWDGIKLIQTLQIESMAFLVTGRDDEATYLRCALAKISLLPKAKLPTLSLKIGSQLSQTRKLK